MPDILAWLTVLWAVSLIAFPAAHLLLGRLPDRGWAISRVLGLLVLAWATWIGGSVGVIPNSPAGIAGTLGLLAVGSGWLAYWQRAELADFLRRRWTVIATAELLFLAMFAFWALVVSEVPAINHTEKLMDFGIMNAVANADGFPPQDQWLAGHSIAYYYGGHYTAAMLATLSGVSADTAYNLAVATIPALLAAGLLGLAYNLLRMAGARTLPALLAGGLTAAGVALLGNLSGVLELAYTRGVGGDGFWQWASIKGLEAPAGGEGWLPDGFWWWWRGSRVIDTIAESGASLDYTITEMPFFSFLLGDLHAHVSALPYALLALTLILALLTSPIAPGLDWVRRRPCEAAALPLALGALAFINAWDFPLYIALAALAALARWLAAGIELPQALARAVLLAVALTAAGGLLYLPFYLSFDSQAAGILPVVGPATRPLHFLIVMGAPALLAAGLTARALLEAGRPAPRWRPAALAAAGVSIAPLLLWVVGVSVRVWLAPGGIDLAEGIIAGRLTLALPLLALGGAGLYCVLTLAAGERPAPWLVFAAILASAGFYLLAGAELFHIADQFGNRMNTVFKVYYQAWLLLGIAGAVGIYYIAAAPARRAGANDRAGILRAARMGWATLAALLLLASAYYPVGAVIERTGWGQGGESWRDNGLAGLDFLRQSAPGEYDAIMWLKREAEPGGIVEAVGDDYSDAGRIAAATGRATVLGWEGHQRQWRGDDQAFAGRRDDVAAIYTSGDGDAVARLLRRYRVRWLVAGPREREIYGAEVEERMAQWVAEGRLAPAFSAADMVIYEVTGN